MIPRPRLIIRVDDDEPFVQIDDLGKRGQWVEFYALLAVVRTTVARADEHVTKEMVHDLACWHHNKTAKSAGHEISRHIDELSESIASPIIASRPRQKTKAWRLELEPTDIEFVPSREIVCDWLHARQVSRPHEHGWIDELRRLADAQIGLMKGRCDQAIDLSTQGNFHRPELDAWAALMLARATDLLNDPTHDDDALRPDLDKWNQVRDAAGMSVAARIQARASLRNRFQKLETEREQMAKLATMLETRGDISALAVVLNVLGILTRRDGHPRDAISHHVRAAALFGICGDFNSLQGAVFNLALCCDHEEPTPDNITLVRICIALSNGLGVGRDSMQAELMGCRWAIELRDFAAARKFLAEAEALQEQGIDATYEHAMFRATRARLDHEDPESTRDVTRDLEVARSMYQRLGDQAGAREVEQLLQRVREL
jgi:hypothetical protein